VYFDLNDLDQKTLEAAAHHYEEHGFILLTGLKERVTRHFRPVLADMIGIDEAQLADILDPNKPADLFPANVRRRLAQVPTSGELATTLIAGVEPVLRRFIGPFVHVSSTFHGQFKGGSVKAVNHGGYVPEDQYMEVHGAYLLHQDFSGATIPTSPSMLTLWVAINSCPDWNLRIYPGSHRHGLLCNEWLQLTDERLAPLGEPIDVPAQEGLAVVFNGLLVHGTSNPGPQRRVSCDIRFFPLCGFLPSDVHFLGERPYESLQSALETAPGPVLRSPLLEDLVNLGQNVQLGDVPQYSVLNWVNYLSGVMRGELDAALPHLERFVNTEIGCDPAEAYTRKFHGRAVQQANLDSVRKRLGGDVPSSPELVYLHP